MAAATLFAPSGAQVVAFKANVVQAVTLPETGTYVVRINASNFADTGSFDVELICP